MLDEKLSIAPMMEWTDPHFRMFMRGITKKTVLYTEMYVDETVIYSKNLQYFMGKFIEEDPSVIQLGGYDPELLGKAAEMCQQYGGGYGELNINCGCPSQRVSKRCFGAKLMLEPERVREIVHTMKRRSNMPVTVKCRIGADDLDTYEDLLKFVTASSAGGARKIIVHSRKCMLKGLSTKQNREVPPLRYEVVHRLVKDFPELTFILNGGIQTLEQAKTHMDHKNGFPFNGTFDTTQSLGKLPIQDEQSFNHVLPPVHGVMLGRAAYKNPLLFATADSEFYGVKDPCLTRRELIERFYDYCEWCQSDEGPYFIDKGNKRKSTTTSVLIAGMRNVIHGIPNTAIFRSTLNDNYVEAMRTNTNTSPREIMEKSLFCLHDEDLDAPLGNPHAADDWIRTYTQNHFKVDTTSRSSSMSEKAVDLGKRSLENTQPMEKTIMRSLPKPASVLSEEDVGESGLGSLWLEQGESALVNS